MKRFLILIVAMVLLIGICGCKQQPVEEAAADSVVSGAEDQDAIVQQEQAGAVEKKSETEEKEDSENTETPKSTEKQENSENTASQPEQPTGESTTPSSTPKEPVIYKPRAPGSLVFDYEDMQLTPTDGFNEVGYTPSSVSLKDIPYSLWIELIGENYLLVAGYATGMRKSFWDDSGSYTDTDFVVTDVYRGVLSNKTIKVRERYAVIQDGETRYMERGDQRVHYLRNDMQVLAFLRPDKEGTYWFEFYQIPLMEDYKDYNEEKLNSILDFYRGDKTRYQQVNERGEWKETYTHKTRGEVTNTYSLTHWPERKISNEALLEEMKENMLLHLATEYKIVIWPYGHKNFKAYPYIEPNFMSICLPNE